MKRCQFVEGATRKQAARECPWACRIVKTEDYYVCFESEADCEDYKFCLKQRKEDERVIAQAQNKKPSKSNPKEVFSCFGKEFTRDPSPMTLLIATRIDGLEQTKRLSEALEQAKSHGDVEEFVLAMCAERNLYPTAMFDLMRTWSWQGAEFVKIKVSQTNSHNASKKGKVWHQAAIEQYRQRKDEFKSLSRFCDDIAEKILTTADGQTETAPKYTQVYDIMRKARKAGDLDD